MKILIDFGHPAHIHYFKNFIRIMKEKGHEFSLVARDKEVLHQLLDHLEISYTKRGTGRKSLLGKFVYLFKAEYIIYKVGRKFNPDLFISFGSTYAAHIARLLKKPHLAFDDTEHAKLELFLYPPFSDVLLNPQCFSKVLGEKQIKFNGYMELCYLHPKYFTPNINVLNFLGLGTSAKYALLRFVSWNASHDVGHSGLDYKTKIDLINFLSTKLRVFISSENNLPEELKKYQISIPVHLMHDALAFATIFVGEGATMASECAMLGTPAIYVNSIELGYCTEEDIKYGLVYNFRNSIGVIDKVKELLANTNLKEEFKKRRLKMLDDKIDVTAFMVWFVENYPNSKRIMIENPDYQKKFK